MPDVHPLKTALIAGGVSFLVSFFSPWALHILNPAGPNSKIIEANGVVVRILPKEIRDQLNKNLAFRLQMLQSFGNFWGFPSGQTPTKQCLGQQLLDDGYVDDECAQRFKTWAVQQNTQAAANLLTLQAAPPPNVDVYLKQNKANLDSSDLLTNQLDNMKNDPKTKSERFVVNVVILNDGDGDDVLYPDASVGCETCAVKNIPLTTDARYVTIKSHSFLAVTCSIDSGKVSSNDSVAIKNTLQSAANIRITTSLHLASRNVAQAGLIQ